MPLLQSRFRGVYLGLAAIWLTLTLAMNILTESWVVPHFLQARIGSVQALVKSHEDALQYYDHRALRDTLVRTNVIAQDQDFEELRPSRLQDRAELISLLHGCRFITEQSCIGSDHALILSGSGASRPMQASFVVNLKTSSLSQIRGIWLWKAVAALSLALLLGFVMWAVRQQEKFLLQKIGLLLERFSEVEKLFLDGDNTSQKNATVPDEFLALSDGIQQAGTILRAKADQIEEYKRRFERKTRLEQLAQTITFTSHELKAPLHEGADFLQDLPSFLDSMPKESILRAARSLERRLRSGAESLQGALHATKIAQSHPVQLSVDSLLKTFARRIQDNPELSKSRLELELQGLGNARIFCDPTDLDNAFSNLYRNSREARGDAEVRVKAWVKGLHVLIRFSDNGPGIPEDLVAQVFDEFFTTKAAGSGLGLSIVYQAIARAGGKVRAISQAGGACFEISLPRVIDGSERMAGPEDRRLHAQA